MSQAFNFFDVIFAKAKYDTDDKDVNPYVYPDIDYKKFIRVVEFDNLIEVVGILDK